MRGVASLRLAPCVKVHHSHFDVRCDSEEFGHKTFGAHRSVRRRRERKEKKRDKIMA